MKQRRVVGKMVVAMQWRLGQRAEKPYKVVMGVCVRRDTALFCTHMTVKDSAGKEHDFSQNWNYDMVETMEDVVKGMKKVKNNTGGQKNE